MVDYRPGHGSRWQLTNNLGVPVVEVCKFTEVEEALAASAAQVSSRPEMLQLIDKAQSLLRKALPRQIPPLESFEIVQDEVTA